MYVEWGKGRDSFLLSLCGYTIVVVLFAEKFSFSVYRKMIDFKILTLYPVILINSLISSTSIFVNSISFFLYRWLYYLQIKSIIFIPLQSGYFQILFLLYYTGSTTILSRSSESRHPCLVLHLKVKPFSFSQLSVMFTPGFS